MYVFLRVYLMWDKQKQKYYLLTQVKPEYGAKNIKTHHSHAESQQQLRGTSFDA